MDTTETPSGPSDEVPVDFPSRFDAGGPIAAPPPRLNKLIVAETPPPALSGGTLAVAKDGTVVVAADSDRDQVYIVTTATEEVRTVVLPKGSEPGRVALDDGGRAHVGLRGRGSVASIDLASATLIKETPVCSLPRGVAFDAAQKAIVVACAGGELVTLSAADHATLASQDLGIDLRDVLIRADGSQDITRYRSAELLHVEQGQLKRSGSPKALQQRRFNFEFDPSSVDAGKPVNPETSVQLSPTLAWKSVAVGESDTMMLHQASQDDEVVISGSGGYGGGCETITQAGLTYYNEAGEPVNTVTLAPHGLVVDVAVSPDGRYAALAEPGSYLQQRPTLELLSVQGIEQPGGVHTDSTIPSRGFEDGGSPLQGSCLAGPGASDDSQVTSVAFDDSGVLYALSREPARLIVFEAQDARTNSMFGSAWPNLVEKTRILLADSSVRDTGHELFHADVGQGLSCAGCHGEALDDGHVWNFRDFGPRRTQSMRGGLLKTLPLHWEGDMPTFKHLVDEVMTRRMGGFQVDETYSAALGTWLDKLPPLKLSANQDASVQRGKQLFEAEEVGCATCHNGPQLTNNESFDVGTGETLQVPTLLGIALHPPFLHDGCAATLEDRFEPRCGGGDRHGHTSHLTAAEIADLVSYLKML
ncbi:MAG: hypothetical protein ABW352_11275 [Polyangiales bacterium]